MALGIIFNGKAGGPNTSRLWGVALWKPQPRELIPGNLVQVQPLVLESNRCVRNLAEPVALGSRWAAKGRVRKADEPPANPDVYPVASGITKVHDKKYRPINVLFGNADLTSDPTHSKGPPADANNSSR